MQKFVSARVFRPERKFGLRYMRRLSFRKEAPCQKFGGSIRRYCRSIGCIHQRGHVGALYARRCDAPLRLACDGGFLLARRPASPHLPPPPPHRRRHRPTSAVLAPSGRFFASSSLPWLPRRCLGFLVTVNGTKIGVFHAIDCKKALQRHENIGFSCL